MTDPVAKLRAALDETERIALAAGGIGWRRSRWTQDEGRVETADGDIVVYDEGVPSGDQAAHIVRHDPASVLRIVAAHRKILAEHPAQERRESWDEYRTICATCTYDSGTDVLAFPCPTVAALAEAYGIEA